MLKSLYLIDESRCKRQTDGIVYAIHPAEVIDMMRRYNVPSIKTNETKNPSYLFIPFISNVLRMNGMKGFQGYVLF